MNVIHNYINGSSYQFQKKNLPIEDPSTGEQIAKVVLSSKDDFQRVLESSKLSQINWSQTTPLKRSRILSNYKTLIEKNIDELASLFRKSMVKLLQMLRVQ